MAIVMFIYGLPIVIKFAAFLGNLNSSDKINIADDKTPPAPPIIALLPKAVPEPNLKIEGTAESGSTVVLNLNGQTTDTLVDDQGGFVFSINLVKIENSFFLVAKDKAGNFSAETKKYQIKLDNIDPLLTISKPTDGTEFYGSGEKQLTIEGETEPDTTLTINDNIAIVSENGKFTHNYNLQDGQNTFNIKSVDEAGNTTEKTISVTFLP